MVKSYPSNVKVTEIIPKQKTYYRTSLVLQNNLRNDQSTVVIMMNPSAADAHSSDNTVNKVIKALSKISQEICIVNLFPFYESNSERLGKLVLKKNNLQIVNQNDLAISEAVKNANKIIFAWGDVPKGLSAKLHNERVKSIVGIIKLNKKENSIYVFNYSQSKDLKLISKKNRPLHPSRRSIHNLKRIKSYYFSRGLLHLKFD